MYNIGTMFHFFVFVCVCVGELKMGVMNLNSFGLHAESALNPRSATFVGLLSGRSFSCPDCYPLIHNDVVLVFDLSSFYVYGVLFFPTCLPSSFHVG